MSIMINSPYFIILCKTSIRNDPAGQRTYIFPFWIYSIQLIYMPICLIFKIQTINDVSLHERRYTRVSNSVKTRFLNNLIC